MYEYSWDTVPYPQVHIGKDAQEEEEDSLTIGEEDIMCMFHARVLTMLSCFDHSSTGVAILTPMWPRWLTEEFSLTHNKQQLTPTLSFLQLLHLFNLSVHLYQFGLAVSYQPDGKNLM